MSTAAGDHGVDVWSSDAWRVQAVEWLDGQLAAAGIERTGEVVQPHVRPWATALTAPTSRGPVWLKAAGPGTAFEVGLYMLLRRVAPPYVLEPLAVDEARGWIVLPDGGPPLGEQRSGEDLLRGLETVLPHYGELQRTLEPHAGDLLALGIDDMRAAALAPRFGEALAAAAGYVDALGGPEDREVLRRVADLEPTVVAWCAELDTRGSRASLDHNDLHPWNILPGAEGRIDRPRFYDWGDSVVAHPFASMLVGLGFARDHILDAGTDTGPWVLRLRDAYLEPWVGEAPRDELVATLELACRVGKVARALTWHRAVAALDPTDVERDWLRAPLTCLASLLDDSYLGGA